MNQAAQNAAVFLDRDGTLIRDVHYLSAVEQIEMLPGVAAALRRLRAHGFKLVMVTNQSAVARGAMSEAELQEIHAEIRARLAQDGARLDAIYYCPHHPTEGLGDYRILCDCRKPKTGMIQRAAADLGIDPKISYVVGDQMSDIELACAVGATGILVGANDATASGSRESNLRAVADLSAAAEWIVVRARACERGTQTR